MNRKWKGLAALLFALLLVMPVQAEETEVSDGKVQWENGIIHFVSDDGNFKTRFDVRIFLNGAYFFEDKNELSNGTHLRKARFAIKTLLWHNWNLEWDMNIAKGIVDAKDMYVSYIGIPQSHIKIGHFKMALGLEELTTSRYITFIERSYPMLAFEVDRRAAIEYSRWGERFNLRTAVFGQKMDIEKNKTIDETGGGAVARFVYAPVKTDNFLIHTGAAYVWENPDNNANMVQYQSEPETKMGDVEILQTPNIPFVDHVQKIGLELAFQYKGFSIQSEIIDNKILRMDGYKDLQFGGGYAFASWILTGEKRIWDVVQGEFGQIIPKSAKWGAWEIAARYSHLDLSDTNAGILGGMANNYTAALNWYPNPNMKFQFNYTMVDNSVNATGDGFIGDDDFSVLHAMIVAYF
jgi:phosphate-selective porin OprO and OprP